MSFSTYFMLLKNNIRIPTVEFIQGIYEFSEKSLGYCSPSPKKCKSYCEYGPKRYFHPNLSVLYYAYFTKQNHYYYFLIIKKMNTKHCKTI